jgi:Protein of unknown function (DUF1571)
MHTIQRLLKSNFLPRLLVGLLIAFFLYCGVTGRCHNDSSPASHLIKTALANQSSSGEDYTDRLIELAKTDHIALLQWARDHYSKSVQDYSATMVKQERINNSLKPIETLDIAFKDKPFSVLMTWRKNPGKVDKLLYSEGSYDNKMVVHPTGLFKWLKSARRDPKSKEARQSSRRTCDQFGFFRSMDSLLKIYTLAQSQEDLRIGYVGKTLVDKRPCIAMERILPPKKEYPYARLVMEFDVEYVVPTAITSYDWQGRLIGRYVYTNLRFNIGLTQDMFTTKANGL